MGGTDPNASCGQLYTECYDLASANGVVHIRGWSSATAPSVQNAWLLAGTCAPDAYFAAADCSAGVQAEVDLGATHPLTGPGVTTQVWATVDGAGKYLLTPGGSSGLVTWTLGSGVPLTGRRAAQRRPRLELRADDRHVERQDVHEQEQQPVQGLGLVRHRAARVRRVGGPLGPARACADLEAERDVRRELVPAGHDADARSQHRREGQPADPVAGDRPGHRAARGREPEPVDRLRPGLCRTCATRSRTAASRPTRSTRASAARRTTRSGALPQPWECVKTQTGGAVGQVEQGMKDRILGGCELVHRADQLAQLRAPATRGSCR